MPRIDYTTKYEKEEGDLQPGIWYRGPLWADDHLLGEAREFMEENLAWCGRALGIAQGMENEFGGLWISERTSGKCSQCRRRQKEWEAR